MKNAALFLLLILSSIIVSAQDTLPNPGFEGWTHSPAGGGYDKPNGWSTYNPLSATLSTFTAFKVSGADAHSGTYAIKLVSNELAGQFAPAVVTTGGINANGIYGGIPINSRPTAINGWYKYFPAGSDQAHLEVYLMKQGAQIGSGVFDQPDTISSWSSFSIPITYTTTDVPDTILVNLFASQGTRPPGAVNSTLYIDDVTYDFSSGIETISTESLTLLPNPASEKITVQIPNGLHMGHLSIHTLDGKLLREAPINNAITEMKVNDLPAGKYLLTAHPSVGNPLTKIFEIQR